MSVPEAERAMDRAQAQARVMARMRDDAMKEGVKALLLMNGGGAAVLLAFLQATWKDNPMLAKYVVAGIAVLAVGVLLAGVVHFLRYDTSARFHSKGRGDIRFKILGRAYRVSGYASLLAFSAAMVILVKGAWQFLPTERVPCPESVRSLSAFFLA